MGRTRADILLYLLKSYFLIFKKKWRAVLFSPQDVTKPRCLANLKGLQLVKAVHPSQKLFPSVDIGAVLLCLGVRLTLAFLSIIWHLSLVKKKKGTVILVFHCQYCRAGISMPWTVYLEKLTAAWAISNTL